jgi:hypothetical protein
MVQVMHGKKNIEKKHLFHGPRRWSTAQDYRRALEELNVQVSASVMELEQEMGPVQFGKSWDHTSDYCWYS